MKLTEHALVSENHGVGVAAAWGARLEADGARIEKSLLAAFGGVGGGVPFPVGDGVGVYHGASAVLSHVTLEANARAGLVAQDPAVNALGRVDVELKNCTFIDGDYGIVINEQKPGATPASVPVGDFGKANSFQGQKIKVDGAGNLGIPNSPCWHPQGALNCAGDKADSVGT